MRRESCSLSRGEVSFVHSFRKAGVPLFPIPSSGSQNPIPSDHETIFLLGSPVPAVL